MNTQLATLTAQVIRMTNTIARLEKQKEEELADYRKSGSKEDKWLYKTTKEQIYEYQYKLEEKNEKILGIINNDPIYMPSAELKYEPPKLPADLKYDIEERNYHNIKFACGLKGYAKYGHHDDQGKYVNSKLWTQQKKDEHDREGFFLINHKDRCGIEVVGKTIAKLNVVGHERNERKLLVNDKMNYNDQDWTMCWDLTKIKGFLTMNKVKGRSKATTMEKAVKLLMSI